MDCDALIAENDENEVRKAFTVSERVAIAAAVAERLKGRQLANLKQHRSGNISGSDEVGETRDLAAAKAGLGSGKTLEAAQAVVSVAVSADWDCGPRAVDAPRQRHHAQHQQHSSTTAAHQQGSAAARARAAPSPRPCPPLPVAPARAMGRVLFLVLACNYGSFVVWPQRRQQQAVGPLAGIWPAGGRRGIASGSFS